jgi:hypothetical protein
MVVVITPNAATIRTQRQPRHQVSDVVVAAPTLLPNLRTTTHTSTRIIPSLTHKRAPG